MQSITSPGLRRSGIAIGTNTKGRNVPPERPSETAVVRDIVFRMSAEEKKPPELPGPSEDAPCGRGGYMGHGFKQFSVRSRSAGICGTC
jgi:hypothetical protein